MKINLGKALVLINLFNKISCKNCNYYPYYPSKSIILTTSCLERCCLGYPKTPTDACCASAFGNWWLSLLAVACVFIFCSCTIVLFLCKRKSKRPSRRPFSFRPIFFPEPIAIINPVYHTDTSDNSEQSNESTQNELDISNNNKSTNDKPPSYESIIQQQNNKYIFFRNSM